MRATAGRKGLLVRVTGQLVRPAIPLGDGWFVWEEGVVVEGWWRSSREEAGERPVRDRDGECLSTLFAQLTILSSMDGSQALACSSASLARNQNLSLLLLLDPHLVHPGQRRAISWLYTVA